MATFWTTDYNAAGVTNPKRSFRFKITIGAFGDTAIGSDLKQTLSFGLRRQTSHLSALVKLPTIT